MQVLSPMSDFPVWGSSKGTGNMQGIWLWREVGFDYRAFTELGETETPLLENTNKILHVPGHRGKGQWLHTRLNQTYLLVLESLVEAWVGHGLPQGQGLSWKEKVKVKLLSRVQLCDPMDTCSLPGSSVHGIFQAGILEWVAISFSRGSSQPRDRTQVSHIAGRRFNLWATREALRSPLTLP